jgi:hypothetical protein
MKIFSWCAPKARRFYQRLGLFFFIHLRKDPQLETMHSKLALTIQGKIAHRGKSGLSKFELKRSKTIRPKVEV